MANYRLSMKIEKIGYAKPHAEYVLREGKYSKGHKREDLQYKESGNMPSWALDNPVEFWEAADYFEPINGRTYREFEVALPNELSLEKNIGLLNEFKDEMLGKDFAYTYAIHTSYSNGQQNTHAHFMFTERKNDGIERDLYTFFKRTNPRYPERGGAKKDREWQKKERLLNARKLFAEITNKHYKRAGLNLRVDHRSNEAQLLEALENGDLNKVEYLTRYPVNIPGRLLNKVEKSLTEWEKKQISEYHINKQIKREKEEAYKAKLNKKDPLEKEDLILEIQKLEKSLDETSLKKSTLNAITNGNYYKHLNKAWKLRKEIKENPTSLELKKELEEVKVKIQEIEDYLPGTSKYIAKRSALSKAYSKKRDTYLQELNDRFNINEADIKEYHAEKEVSAAKENVILSKLRKKVDLTNHFILNDSLQRTQEKLNYLNEEYLENQPSRRVKEINREVKQLTLEKGILEDALLKTGKPSKSSLNQHNIRKLINLRGEYESTKFNIDRLKEKLITTSNTIDLKDVEVEKKIVQYAKIIDKNTEKAIVLERLIEKQEEIVKTIPKLEVIQVTKEYLEKENTKQVALKQGIVKLEKLLKSKDQIQCIAINSLTKGKYNNLQERKATFEKNLFPLLEKKQILKNKIILSSGFMATLERRKYQKELKALYKQIKPHEDRYTALKKEEEGLIKNLDPKAVDLKTSKLHESLSNALYKVKGELAASSSKSFVSFDLERSRYKELHKKYSKHKQKHNSNTLKEIDKLLKDDVNLSKARYDLKNRIFKHNREDDVVELEI